MVPEFPELTRCRNCDQYYWLEDAECKGVLDTGENWAWQALKSSDEPDTPEEIPAEWHDAPPTRFLTLREYLEALQAGLGTPVDREKYLRIRVWWGINDFVRDKPFARIPEYYVQVLQDNLTRLAALLDETDPDERMMKAEIARETGDFAETIRLCTDAPEAYRRLAKRFLYLSRQQDCSLVRL